MRYIVYLEGWDVVGELAVNTMLTVISEYSAVGALSMRDLQGRWTDLNRIDLVVYSELVLRRHEFVALYTTWLSLDFCTHVVKYWRCTAVMRMVG